VGTTRPRRSSLNGTRAYVRECTQRLETLVSNRAFFRPGCQQTLLKNVDSTEQFVQACCETILRLQVLSRVAFMVLRSTKKLVMFAVSIPKSAIPVTMRNAAIPLPAGVTGKVSP
jgi:hypothetical protein